MTRAELEWDFNGRNRAITSTQRSEIHQQKHREGSLPRGRVVQKSGGKVQPYKGLLNSVGELFGHGSGAHYPGDLDDVVE